MGGNVRGYYNSSTGTSYSRVYEVPSLGQYKVTNYVYEMSPTYLATLGIRSVYGYGEATGQMSPDCAGSYTRLY
ncbi:MAG: hypothetical protein J6A25_11995 [Lachnospiraceae bacterium]|nr:hypothetical protein [Lachnospiraceae bacterium]